MKHTSGHKGSPIGGETHSKIEAHIRKHRAGGGKVESAMRGTDDAEEDLKTKPDRRNNAGKIFDEAEEKAKGGKCEMRAKGGSAKKHAGRKPRARGGGCESQPFTTALKGSGPRESRVAKETKGDDD